MSPSIPHPLLPTTSKQEYGGTLHSRPSLAGIFNALHTVGIHFKPFGNYSVEHHILLKKDEQTLTKGSVLLMSVAEDSPFLTAFNKF